MKTFLLFSDSCGSDGPKPDLSPKTSECLHSITFQKLKKMKNKLIILGLLSLPLFMHAQTPEKCSDFVVIPKSVYDSFQTQRANLTAAEREITKERTILEDLQKRFLECERAPDVAAMVQQAEEAIKAADANRKTAADAFDKVDKEVREIIRAAGGRPVGYRYLDSWSGEFGQVVTIKFDIMEGKVKTTPFYYPLPGTATR